jgi:hypothetical protein
MVLKQLNSTIKRTIMYYVYDESQNISINL